MKRSTKPYEASGATGGPPRCSQRRLAQMVRGDWDRHLHDSPRESRPRHLGSSSWRAMDGPEVGGADDPSCRLDDTPSLRRPGAREPGNSEIGPDSRIMEHNGFGNSSHLSPSHSGNAKCHDPLADGRPLPWLVCNHAVVIAFFLSQPQSGDHCLGWYAIGSYSSDFPVSITIYQAKRALITKGSPLGRLMINHVRDE
jgi:hypothetical protein